MSNVDRWEQWRSLIDVLIAHHSEPQILVEQRDGHWCLPRVPIKQLWKVPLHTINAEIQQRYGIETAILYLVAQQRDEEACTITSLRLLESQGPHASLAANQRWIELAELETVVFANQEQAQAAHATMAEIVAGTIPSSRAAWARPGWYRETQHWILASLNQLGYQPLGPIEQIKTWVLSCILRVATDRGLVYFKANNPSPLMGNEALLSDGLAKLYPEHLITPLLIEPARDWMLLPDFGTHLQELGFELPIEVRETVLCTFARLQIASASQLDALFALGCIDRRLDKLAAAIEPLVHDALMLASIDEAQQQQLQAAVPQLKALCAELATYSIPATLSHGDLHMANVARRADSYLFFDWTDAAITHPFLDMIDILHEQDAALQARLRDSYLLVWTDYEPIERLMRMWQIAYPLCALHQAISYQALIHHVEPLGREAFNWAMPFWFGQIVTSLSALEQQR